MNIILLDHSSSEPKYQQVVNSVIKAIDNKELRVGDKIPSVNEVSDSTGIARKTVVQAFEQLKQAGIIYSVKYKGYFVASRKTNSKHNIFVLFNTFTVYKEEIYESMKNVLKDKGVVDIFFHHDNLEVFKTLIENSAGKYTEYIIMPLDDQRITPSLKKLPQEKVYILDLGYRDWGSRYPSVCQYFEEDIYDGLQKVRSKLRKYRKIIFVTGNRKHYKPVFAYNGLVRFCKEEGFEYDIMKTFDNYIPVKEHLYIVVDDNDLVYLIKQTIQHVIKPGGEIGIISYNETPFKEIIGKGIATISTDFTQMGKSIVNMILKKQRLHIKNPSKIIARNSF